MVESVREANEITRHGFPKNVSTCYTSDARQVGDRYFHLLSSFLIIKTFRHGGKNVFALNHYHGVPRIKSSIEAAINAKRKQIEEIDEEKQARVVEFHRVENTMKELRNSYVINKVCFCFSGNNSLF